MTIEEALRAVYVAVRAVGFKAWSEGKKDKAAYALILEDVMDAVETYGITVLELADDGNASSVCSEYCIHRTDDPKGCPVNILEALRQRIRGEK